MHVYAIAEQIGTNNDHVLKVLRDEYGLDVSSASSEINDKLADCLIHSDSFKSAILGAECRWDRANALAHVYRLAGAAYNMTKTGVATALYEIFWCYSHEYGIPAEETQVFTSEANLGE